MIVRTRRLAAVAVTAALLLPIAACDDQPIGPADRPGIEFRYDGAWSGIYRSEAGEPALSAEGLPEFGSWAVARTDSLDGLVIAGFSPTDESKGDLFILHTVNLHVDEHLEIVDGSIEFAEASEQRIRGTFEFALENQDGSRTLTVTDGVVDLPYSSEPFESGSIACLAQNLLAGTNESC